MSLKIYTGQLKPKGNRVEIAQGDRNLGNWKGFSKIARLSPT